MTALPPVEFVSRICPDSIGTILTRWAALEPRLGVLALLAAGDLEQLSVVRAAAETVGLPLVGGVFPQLVTSQGFTSAGVWLISLGPQPVMGLVPSEGLEPSGVAERVAQRVAPALTAGRPPSTLLLLIDGTEAKSGTLLDEVYLLLGGAVRYVGASVGDESFTAGPCVFDERLVCSAAVGFALLPGQVMSRLQHDFSASAECSVATSVIGNRIASVDFRPAFDFYADRIRTQFGVELTRTTFYRYAVAFPLAVQLASGQLLVRIPVGVDDDGSLRCIGEVPENALLVVAKAPEPSDDAEAERTASRLLDAAGAPLVLLFYCAARRMWLGEHSTAEVRAVAARGQGTLMGAVSLGEMGSSSAGSYPVFQNGALLYVAWSDT